MRSNSIKFTDSLCIIQMGESHLYNILTKMLYAHTPPTLALIVT
jgi:hypothetical protein